MWIEAHQQLRQHPKVLRLARNLRIAKPQAIGHLLLLWWWTLDYAPSGDVSAFSSHDLASAAEWTGSVDHFREALVDAGWLDHDGLIHDWADYAGKLVAARAADKERKRRERAERLSNPNETARPPDVRRTSEGCPPLPNPTVPDPTVPAADSEARARPDATEFAETPSLAEVCCAAEMQGAAKWLAEDFFCEFESVQWKFRGQQVRNWRALFTKRMAWWREEGAPPKRPTRNDKNERNSKPNPRNVGIYADPNQGAKIRARIDRQTAERDAARAAGKPVPGPT